MKITQQNISISFSILFYWMKSMILITFSHPRSYLEKYLKEPQANNTPSEREWLIAKKVVKGTRKISPLFNKHRKCLIESQIVHDVLKSQGIQSQLKLGAKSQDKKISTHAWIEIDGKIVIGGPLINYKPLIRTH